MMCRHSENVSIYGNVLFSYLGRVKLFECIVRTDCLRSCTLNEYFIVLFLKWPSSDQGDETKTE